MPQQLFNSYAFNLATLFLLLFCILGAFDGVYFHLIKFKLHTLASARKEHAIHSIRAFVFAPIALLLFVINASGLLLLSALVLVFADLVLEYYDIMLERDARAPIGGVPGTEAVLHVFASSAKLAAIALILATKPLPAYAVSAAPQLPTELPILLQIVGGLFALGTLSGGLVSVMMSVREEKRQRAQVLATVIANY